MVEATTRRSEVKRRAETKDRRVDWDSQDRLRRGGLSLNLRKIKGRLEARGRLRITPSLSRKEQKMSTGCKALQIDKATPPRSAEKESKQERSCRWASMKRGTVCQTQFPARVGKSTGATRKHSNHRAEPCCDRNRGFVHGVGGCPLVQHHLWKRLSFLYQ